MYRDPGSRTNLGFGIPLTNTDVEQGRGNQNFVQRALNDHPVMRFFAVAAASAVSMNVAGKIVREGGLRLVNQAQTVAAGNSRAANYIGAGIKSFRRIEDHLDALQGLERELVDPGNPDLLVKRVNGKLVRDKTTTIDSFNIRLSRLDRDPDLTMWSYRDEIQQRLVRQARRLPYEAPGLYIAQKGIIDPLTGENKDPVNKVNWHNPVDVIGDFAWQTIKGVGLNVAPADIGGGALRQGFRSQAAKMAQQPGGNMGYMSMRVLLNQIGIDAANVIDNTIKFSNRTAGAFSAMVNEAQNEGTGFGDWVRTRRNAALTNTPQYGNSNFAKRLFLQAKDITQNKDARRQAIDTLPGPFKGMGSGAQKFGKTFKQLGQVHDDWQNVLSGRTTLDSLRRNQPDRYLGVIDYMAKGGGTSLEQFGRASFDLGRGGPLLANGRVNPAWGSSPFRTQRVNETYKTMLVDELSNTTGLHRKDALKFVSQSMKVTPYPGGRAPFPGGENLAERFNYVSNRFHGDIKKSTHENTQDWWSSVTRAAGRHGIPLGDKMSFDLFRQAVKTVDAKFSSGGNQAFMESGIRAQWNATRGHISKHAADAIPSMRKPYELFKGTNLNANSDFLVKRTAQRLGIPTIDNAGNAIPLANVKSAIFNRGLNPDDLHGLRGFLVDQKDIHAPWRLNGRNLFGFRAMTVEEGLRNRFFGGSDRGTQQEIRNIVDQRTFGGQMGRGGNINPTMSTNSWDLKVNKVYIGPNGKVLDFGRVARSMMSVGNKLASDYHIPVLHMKPLQMGGWSSFQSMRNKPPVIMESAMSMQPFAMAQGPGFKAPDFYLWMKSSANKSKGHLAGISGNAKSGVTVQDYKGLFRPNTTNPLNMLGRYGNILTGSEDTPGSINHDQRWKRLFDVNFNQPNNLVFGRNSTVGRWYQSISRGPTASRNANNLANRIADASFSVSNLTPDDSEGFENLVRHLRNYGFSNKTLKELSVDPRFSNIFNLKDPLGNNILDVPDNILPRAIEGALLKDRKLLGNTADGIRVKKLQQNLLNLIRQGKQQNDFWGLAAPEDIRATGISRRIDQLKGELYDYLVARTSNVGSNSSFTNNIQALVAKLDELQLTGVISKAEKAEGRAAILSLQVENARNLTYVPGADNFLSNHNANTLRELFDHGVEVRQLMREVGTFSAIRAGGNRGFLRQQVSRLTTTVPYEKPFQNRPTGAHTLFMPTFRTAFQNNPRKATAGMLGLNWRDPQALSGAALPATHLTMRLNRYLETFNVGLDPTRYNSPASFFAKGMVGKRILPVYAAGATALALDRQAGGMVNDRDMFGNRVYSPLVLGVGADMLAAGQASLAGLIPGGQTMEEKRRELLEGEVPIRSGRYWMMGNTPFKGGRIQYFRPSWYQRFKAGGAYTPEMNETPLERLAFGYDFSPLRPFDPYRREREDYSSRPYPLTGDYFTGPWGPLNPILNATIGKVLKPKRRMHMEDTAYMLGQYQPVGEGGAYMPQQPVSRPIVSSSLGSINASYSSAAPGTPSSAIMSQAMGTAPVRGTASAQVRQRATDIATMYSSRASTPGSYLTANESLVPYGVPVIPGLMSPRVVSAVPPLDGTGINVLGRNFAYRLQEITGIYGFTLGSVRSGLGFGSQDLAPTTSVLEPASRGYSASRSFWNLNLGGVGDVPMPGGASNLEISEIIRRFVPRDPQGITYINNIANDMGKMYPWLPGVDYPLANLKAGDPYNAIPDADIRLPGSGYARTHTLYSDSYAGRLGLANIHDILGDVAPWSQQYEAIDKAVDRVSLSTDALGKINQTRAQVEAMRYENEFTPYKHRYDSVLKTATDPTSATGRFFEWLAHRDTYVNTKLGAPRTAVEDWERDNVYGASFPKWQTPYESFIRPAINKSTQRDVISATLAGGGLGYLFGATAQAKSIGSVLGGVMGASTSLYGMLYQKVTGDRFIPLERRKQLALEENVDILNYTRSQVLATAAYRAGDQTAAQYFLNQSKQTMYGADLNGTPEQIAMAVPKRKREHFRAMLYAPTEEREQILSTAGRLERRLFQAAWGMQVEQRPDLNEYYSTHELPPPDADVWRPEVSMDVIKIKMGQHMGLDMSQMGYYPQQIQEANLINPSYPDPFASESGFSVKARLKRLLLNNGINGEVIARPSAYSSDRMQLDAGVY